MRIRVNIRAEVTNSKEKNSWSIIKKIFFFCFSECMSPEKENFKTKKNLHFSNYYIDPSDWVSKAQH